MDAAAPMAEPRGSADSHAIRYRADIDGLRAIAVLAVIAFHFNRQLLPGGYLGVDIFFVISGFLITGIIWREIRGASFTYARFYERRIRRIAPALLLMLSVTALFAFLALMPEDLVGFAKSVLATIAFAANVYFWRDSDYFSTAAEQKPLLHMWSLGVEEQFYILFPIILAVLARRAARRALLAVIITCLVSFALNIWLDRAGGATTSFYLLPTRAWELGAGAVVALLPQDRLPGRRVAMTLSVVAGVILPLTLLVNPTWLVGSLPDATLAVAATAILLWTGRVPSPPHRLLSVAPVRFIGLISYSLYLWHWPVIVLARYWLVRDMRPAEVVAAFAVMLVLAVLSWRFVERPTRSKALNIRRLYMGVGAAAALIAAAAISAIVAQGWPGRLPPAAARINAVIGTFYRCPLTKTVQINGGRGCAMALPGGHVEQAEVALVGNSHALMYAPMLADELAGRGKKGILFHANRCLPSVKLNVLPSCFGEARSYLDAVVRNDRIDIVFLALDWDNPRQTRFFDSEGRTSPLSRQQAVIAAIDDTIALLQRSGKKVVVVGPIAVPGFELGSMAGRQVAYGRPVTVATGQSIQQFNGDVGQIIAHYAARGDIVFVRPDKVQCNAMRCSYFAAGVPLFGDSTHLAQSQLHWFRPLFAAALDRATAPRGADR